MSGPAKFVPGARRVRSMKEFLQGILDDLCNGRSFRRGPDFGSPVQAIIKVESRTHAEKHIDEAEICQWTHDFSADESIDTSSTVEKNLLSQIPKFFILTLDPHH